jgi:serine/threonine protein kinase
LTVSYCINPKCFQRQNPDHLQFCQACGTPLLIQERYRLIEPLREPDELIQTEIFAIEDRGIPKVLKVLKNRKLAAMFQREAETLQQLRHSGVPRVEPDGYFTLSVGNGSQELSCLVMEKIDGKNLEQWLEKHSPISQELALKWLTQLTEILGALHHENLFHRDIKLSNIMLRPDEQLALVDFGTVRQITNTYLAKIGGDRDITGIVSPGYTPLEQVNGKAVPQSDFYALGRSLVYLLTGKHPVDLSEDAQTGQLIWRDHAPQVSDWLADLIDDLMAPFPGQRPLNTSEILQRLAIASTPPAAKLSAQTSPQLPTQIPRLNWLMMLNLALFITQLIVGGLWLASQQRQPSNQTSQTSNLLR